MIISIINLKGGVGKTTTAIALATAVVRDKKQVEVYDSDPQSSASLWAMVAEENNDPLPFSVVSANIATVRSAEQKYKGDTDKWIIIDCPPSGHVMDEAMKVADLVIVPTKTGPADLIKAFETADTLVSRDVCHAILLTQTLSRTLTLKQSMLELEERDSSYLEAQIPNREALKNFFGNSFGDDLFGYEEVYKEIKKGLEDGD